METWFSRAGPTIPLQLRYTNHIIAFNQASLKSLLQRYQSRWSELDLAIHPMRFVEIIADLPSSNWTNLTNICLWDHELLFPEKCTKCLKEVTSLRRLTLQPPIAYEHIESFGPVSLVEIRFVTNGYLRLGHAQLISSYLNLRKLEISSLLHKELLITPGLHLTLPLLATFILNAGRMSILDHLTTPALVDMEIYAAWPSSSRDDEHCISTFLSRCPDSLKSFKIHGQTRGASIARILPSLSDRPFLTHLAVNAFPLPMDDSFFDENEWLPSLRDLSISLERNSGRQPVEELEYLAMFLKRRVEFHALPMLETLTIHKRSSDEFPYHLFGDVPLGRLRVMIPF
jgi:hypothetical protein